MGMFNIQQKLKDIEFDVDAPNPELSFSDRRKQLIEAFGGKKTKQLFKSQQDQKVVHDVKIAEAVTQVITENKDSTVPDIVEGR